MHLSPAFAAPRGLCTGAGLGLGAGLTLRTFAPRSKRPRRKKQWVALEGEAPRRVAVVGGGLAGLATVWHTLHSTRRFARKRGVDYTQIQVTLYDPAVPGTGGATAAAAGLLHPFTPRVKKKAWHAKKALPAVTTLVEAAQKHCDVPLMRVCGLVRVAIDAKAIEDYKCGAYRFPHEVQYWEPEVVKQRCPHVGASGRPAAFLPHAAVVDVPRYVAALHDACVATGRVTVVREAITDVRDALEDHDAVVVAAGASILGIDGLREVNVKPCRGQNILYKPNQGATQPTFPIISGKYVVPDVFGREERLLGGATFEYQDETETEIEFLANGNRTNVKAADKELAEPLNRLVPSLERFWKPDTAVAGVRALPPRSTLGSVPLAARCQGVPAGKSLWVLTALGSRGVLFHAYMGRCVAQAVVAGNEKLIPIDARRVQMKLGL